MLLAHVFVDRAVGRGQQPDGGDFAAAAAGTMAAGHRVVVVVIEHQALAVAARLQRVFGEACGGIRQQAQKAEVLLHLGLGRTALTARTECAGAAAHRRIRHSRCISTGRC